jgi:LTXXQ motif family protein
MSGSKNPKSINLRSVFGTAAAVSPTASPRCMWPDQAAVVQRLLMELKSDLHISADEHDQWAVFSDAVLAQMERLTSAREAADGVPWSDPASVDRKREFIKQVIATPVLLSLAARTLYSALTPEQQSSAGGKLLHFHRRLVA